METSPRIPAEHFPALFAAVSEPLLVLLPDERFTIVDVTDTYLSETLTRRGEILGRGLFDVFPDNPNTPEANSTRNLRASLLRVVASRRPDTMAVQRYDVPRPDGGGFELRYWCPLNTPVPGADGSIQYIIHRVQNVTDYVMLEHANATRAEESARLNAENRRMEAEILRRTRDLDLRNAELREANQTLTDYARRKDEFLAMLAHELRNPMAGISSALELLSMAAGQDERARKLHHVCRRQMDNLVRLVDDLLDVSRISRGAVELRSDRLELRDIVQSAVSAVDKLFERAGVRLRLCLEPGSYAVTGDATRLEQVLSNVLSNAAKCSDAGNTVELALEPGTLHGRPVARIAVRDQGRGIPPTMLDAIFEMFVQVDTSIDRARGGLGIGLTLARRLAQMHGGTLVAHSDGPGKGSTFVLCLPLDEGPALPAPTKAARSDAGPSRRVLLVEDNADARDTLAALLRANGHDVQCASDGNEGLARLLDWQPELAFVDIGLPGLDGLALARAARSAARRTLLVGLSGYGGAHAQASARAAGFDAYLVKPLDAGRLHALMAKVDHLAR